MHPDNELAARPWAHPGASEAADTPSADFVRAVSDFLDTDPADLLKELGYYNRADNAPAPPENTPAADSQTLVLR